MRALFENEQRAHIKRRNKFSRCARDPRLSGPTAIVSARSYISSSRNSAYAVRNIELMNAQSVCALHRARTTQHTAQHRSLPNADYLSFLIKYDAEPARRTCAPSNSRKRFLLRERVRILYNVRVQRHQMCVSFSFCAFLLFLCLTCCIIVRNRTRINARRTLHIEDYTRDL